MKLLGVVVMRGTLLAQSSQRLEEIMLSNPFYPTNLKIDILKLEVTLSDHERWDHLSKRGSR